jgi:hypothetical protein
MLNHDRADVFRAVADLTGLHCLAASVLEVAALDSTKTIPRLTSAIKLSEEVSKTNGTEPGYVNVKDTIIALNMIAKNLDLEVTEIVGTPGLICKMDANAGVKMTKANGEHPGLKERTIRILGRPGSENVDTGHVIADNTEKDLARVVDLKKQGWIDNAIVGFRRRNGK